MVARLSFKSRYLLYSSSKRHITTQSTRNESNNIYCIQLVRNCDYENYLCTVLLPKEAQPAVFAVRAFNAEVAQAKDVTSKREIARMRLQFWHDCVNEIYKGKARETPVAKQLSYAVQRHSLSKKWLLDVLDTRVNNLEDKPFLTLEEAEKYSEKVHTSLNYLVLQCLGIQDLQADHTASHLGRCQGLITLLRSVPYHAQRGNVLLPSDLMIKHGVSQTDVLRASRTDAVKDMAFEVATEANIHLEKARSFKPQVPQAAIPAFLPAVCCEAYLKALQRAHFDVFDSRLQARNGWLPLLLWWQKRKRTY